MTATEQQDEYADIRDAVAKLCAQFPGEYWRQLDREMVYLHALALSKRHYGQPDANDYELMANAYRGDLIAGTHQTAHYIPGTIAVPPAVRPTLIQFSDGQSG